MQKKLFSVANLVGQTLIAKNFKIVTAESCTGGGLAYWLTAISGSSAWFDRGVVTYQDSAKEELLHISASDIKQFGAVSKTVASQMAQQALTLSHAQIAIATTGIAGPTGGTPDKPVGLVWIAWITPTQSLTQDFLFIGDRQAVREQTILQAFEGLLKLLNH